MIDDALLDDLRARHRRREISTEELKRRVLAACHGPKEDPWAAFGAELALIRDEGLRRFTAELIGRLPGYFWRVPASVVGLHAIPSDNAVGGLVRHTRKVARMARSMGDPWGLERLADDLVVAAFLHDGLKYGWDGALPPEHDHASFAATWLRKEGVFRDRPEIPGMVGAHLGRWGKWKPRTEAEWAFHLADYVVSRGAVPSANGRR